MRAIEVLWMLVQASSFIWMNTDAQIHQRILETGFSDQYRSENTMGQYAFGYNEDHTSGGSFRREMGDEFGNKIGSYGLRVSDGRLRIVNYVADARGFRADVLSNEPGLAPRPFAAGHSVSRPSSLRGIAVPGFSYAGDAPRVVFGARLPTETSTVAATWDDEGDYAQASAPEVVETAVTEPTPKSEGGDENVLGEGTAASEVSGVATEELPVTTANSTTVVDLESAA